MNTEDMAFVVVIIMVVFGAGMFIGGCSGERHKQKQAVEAGVAEFYLDTEHEKQFRWKTNNVEKIK